MLWPSFLNAALLGGLVAVGIPILIHLMFKTRQRRMKFSTLRFFDFLDEEAVRSRKLRHWLLLLLRLLIVILLVLAFARPFLPQQSAAAAGARPQLAVLLLDRSLSLTARDPEGSRWDRARAAARKILYQLPREARVGLLVFGGHAEWLATPGPAADTLKALDAAQPVMAGGEMGDALDLAARFFAQEGSRSTNSLYIISDLQRTSCKRVPHTSLPADVRVHWLPVSDPLTPNLAVTEVNLAGGSGQTSTVLITNFDTEDAGPVTAQLLVDGKLTASRTLLLPGGTHSNLDFTLPRLTAGWHSVAVHLETADPLPADNTRFQAVFIPPLIPVLLLEPRAGVKIYQEETFYLRTALDPHFGQTNSGLSGFAVDTTPPDAFIHRLATGTPHGPYALVMAPGLKRWPPGAADALLSFVEKGGGLLLFAGEGISVNHYTTELGALLPGQWGLPESATDLDWRIWEWEKSSPLFAPFRQPNSGSPSVARFNKRLALQARDGDQVLARFQDGQPAMLLRRLGQGMILFFNATADTQWHDWPRHKTFVPWLHSTARFLAGRSVDLEGSRPPACLAGTEASLTLKREDLRASLKWVQPDGRPLEVQADDQGAVHQLAMPLPGIYSLRDAQGRELYRMAANVPAEESDLTAFTPQEMQHRLVRAETPAPHSPAALLFGSDTGPREWWRFLLLAGLLFMLAETIVGNRTVP
ncbi:MAG: BatA domain-containing protein [Verrucomicrobiae bacterium]|nr:BatA domain-containing protein [Verrucomicrobiae bacterium]